MPDLRVNGQVHRLDPQGLRSDPPDDLDGATPLPGNEYKLEIARALVRRALDQLP